jgi:hypothetical protein
MNVIICSPRAMGGRRASRVSRSSIKRILRGVITVWNYWSAKRGHVGE